MIILVHLLDQKSHKWRTLHNNCRWGLRSWLCFISIYEELYFDNKDLSNSIYIELVRTWKQCMVSSVDRLVGTRMKDFVMLCLWLHAIFCLVDLGIGIGRLLIRDLRTNIYLTSRTKRENKEGLIVKSVKKVDMDELLEEHWRFFVPWSYDGEIHK